jgi:hypothetical protein
MCDVRGTWCNSAYEMMIFQIFITIQNSQCNEMDKSFRLVSTKLNACCKKKWSIGGSVMEKRKRGISHDGIHIT